jgi:hypothetical protein
MSRRVFGSFVVLVYLSAVVALGVHHHHEHADVSGHDSQCAACQWQLQGNAEKSPCPVALPPLRFLTFQDPVPARSQAERPYLSSTDSRAPPIARA